MFTNILIMPILCIIFMISCNEINDRNTIVIEDNKKIVSINNYKVALTQKEIDVLVNKRTEFPFTGDLLNNKEVGIYSCKVCGADLFKSADKFNSGTGWPSFDDSILENIKLIPDGYRVEVVCRVCESHLGYLFYNEGFTHKDTHYRINSLSLSFKKSENEE